jgi:ribosomal protein S10
MELSDVYKTQVKPSVIPLAGLPRSVKAPVIERDPNANAFERRVFQRLMSVVPPEPTENRVIPKAPVINHVSFEDALRELTAMNK